MPQPHPFPCGGEGQDPCPPQPTDPIQLNVGDVFTVGGQSFVIGDLDEQAPKADEVVESSQSSEATDEPADAAGESAVSDGGDDLPASVA